MIPPWELLDWKLKTAVLTRNEQTDKESLFTGQERESCTFTGCLSSSAGEQGGGCAPWWRGGWCVPVTTAGREGGSSKGPLMSGEGCWWLGMDRRNLVWAPSSLFPQRDCCSKCTWVAVDDHTCMGREAEESLFVFGPFPRHWGMSWSMPHPSSQGHRGKKLNSKDSPRVGGRI